MAFLIDAHSKEDKAVTFTSTKVRSGPDLEFTSIMNWVNLRLGPQDTAKPAEKKSIKDGTRKIGQQPKPEDSDLV